MDIPYSAAVVDVDLLQSAVPSSDRKLAVVSLVSGKVGLVDYSGLNAETAAEDQTPRKRRKVDGSAEAEAAGPSSSRYSKLWTLKPSTKSCRSARFSTEGDAIYALTKDRTISRLDVETGKAIRQWKRAHESAPSRVLPMEAGLFATGDDDGTVKLWDPRRPSNSDGDNDASCVRSYSHHSDWVTDMIWQTSLSLPAKAGPGKSKRETTDSTGGLQSRLLVVAGDGILSVIDPRASPKAVECSEDQEDELLSLKAVKGGDKIVVGTALGPLSIWAPKKGLLDHVDRLAGHPASVDSIDVIDEDTIVTGSSDGLVRVVQIYPHKLLGVVADHEGFPVERVVHAGNILASVGHENHVRLTDLHELLEASDDDEDEDDAEIRDSQSGADESSDTSCASEKDGSKRRGPKTARLLKQSARTAAVDTGFFDGL